MTPGTIPDREARHRLLEGLLLRLARRSDTADLVLRGGVLLRHWFRPIPRAADDLDLIATFPFDAEAAVRRFLPVLSEPAADGVTFDADAARFEVIHLDTGAPGVRVFASGFVAGVEDDFHADITFGPPPRPAAERVEIPTATGAIACVWACRPETVAAQKVQALCHLGVLGWRPKDLNDLRLLLDRVPMSAAELHAAVAAYLADIRRPGFAVAEAVGPDGWLHTKFASARWLDFVAESRGCAVPRELSAVAAGVAARLLPPPEGTP